MTRWAGLTKPHGEIPQPRRILLTYSVAMTGALAGTSTFGPYVESAAGGRSGLTAIVTGAQFVAVMFAVLYAQLVPLAATSPALCRLRAG